VIFALLLAIAPFSPVDVKPQPAQVVWRSDVMPQASAMAGDTLILATGSRVVALDAATGATKWEVLTKGNQIVVDGDRVVIGGSDEVVIIALHDGRVLFRRAMPEATNFLKGLPLVAASNGWPSHIYLLDRDGAVRAKRIVRHIESMWIADGTIVVSSTANAGLSEGPTVVAGFSTTDLAPLWKFNAFNAELQKIAGRWYFGATPIADMFRLDPTTGHRGAAMPPKEPALDLDPRSTWEVEIDSLREWHRARIRINDPATGHARWTVDLPFAVAATLSDGPHFYAAGLGDNDGIFIAEIDAATGHVQRIYSGGGVLIDSLVRHGDLLIGIALREGVVAIRLPR